MPTTWSVMRRPHPLPCQRLFDVFVQRAQVRDLRQPALELGERRRCPGVAGVPLGEARLELGLERLRAAPSSWPRTVSTSARVPASPGASRSASSCSCVSNTSAASVGRHPVVAIAQRRAVQLEPVATARDRIAQRAIGAVHRRARDEAQLAAAVGRYLMAIRVDGARGVVEAPLELVAIDDQTARQTEDGEQVDRLRQRLRRLAAADTPGASPARPAQCQHSLVVAVMSATVMRNSIRRRTTIRSRRSA